MISKLFNKLVHFYTFIKTTFYHKHLFRNKTVSFNNISQYHLVLKNDSENNELSTKGLVTWTVCLLLHGVKNMSEAKTLIKN